MSKAKRNISTRCAKCLGLLGTESRLKIYKLIKLDGEDNVSDVVSAIGLTQPTVSYHLKEMKDAGILVSRKNGREIFYRINEICPDLNVECVLSKLEFPKSENDVNC